MTIDKKLGAQPTKKALAQAIVKLAAVSGMPDTFWATDTRVALARHVLGERELRRVRRLGAAQRWRRLSRGSAR
jgi:hypothetical protein